MAIDCQVCGNPDPVEIRPCPFCGAHKCEECDMGDDVECAECEYDEENTSP